MNTPVFKHALKNCTNAFGVTALLLMTLVLMMPTSAHADWKVDFSRRTRATREADLQVTRENNDSGDRSPSSVSSSSDDAPSRPTSTVANDEGPDQKKGLLESVFGSNEPVQEIVILNTEKGFIPSSVHVRKNGRYKIHVVNVNEKEKNVSFILDGFSEHHATFYGKIKTFDLEPKKEGIYSFQSPETAAEGRLVVFNPQMQVRAPASGDDK